jgi:hypothetical protein
VPARDYHLGVPAIVVGILLALPSLYLAALAVPPSAASNSAGPDLDAQLTKGDRPWPRIAVLYGLSGVGKTSAAAEYAHRKRAEVRVAWQFAAEDPVVLLRPAGAAG